VTAAALSDLELLRIEMDMLWRSDNAPDLVLACAREGMRVRVTPDVPEWLATLARAEVESASPRMDVMLPPPLVERMRLLLEDALGASVAMTAESGPSYVIHQGVHAATSAQLVRSDAPGIDLLRQANPGNWAIDEWQHLLQGDLGPWVMATVEQRVVSICHTARSSSRAAEAGVWTHPDHRGQGHAAACTAEWASLMRPSQRLLYYSTSRTNGSSQRVAARLGLRHLGCVWQLSRAAFQPRP
jgi:hypothetical protein